MLKSNVNRYDIVLIEVWLSLSDIVLALFMLFVLLKNCYKCILDIKVFAVIRYLYATAL
jgi:hypothetical protein